MKKKTNLFYKIKKKLATANNAKESNFLIQKNVCVTFIGDIKMLTD